MNISMDKKYTVDGKPFTLLTVTKPGDYPVIGHTPEGALYHFFINGTSTYGGAHLVEVSPYADFKIDEPVMVRDIDYLGWRRCYFAGITKNGDPSTWIHSLTKWASKAQSVGCLQCRRPTAEELAT